MKIKGWEKFQHYKAGERKPSWIKLHRSILDDMEWHDLDPSAAKTLVMLWLIASEADGMLPDIKKLAFRLRMTEQRVSDAVAKLSHWLEQDASNSLADGYQTASLEEERETEEEKEQTACASPLADDFENWWKVYPHKASKGAARKAYLKARKTVDVETLLAGAKRYAADPKRDPAFTKHAATWLNAECWLDEQPSEKPTLVADPLAELKNLAWRVNMRMTNLAPVDSETIVKLIQMGLTDEKRARAYGWTPASELIAVAPSNARVA